MDLIFLRNGKHFWNCNKISWGREASLFLFFVWNIRVFYLDLQTNLPTTPLTYMHLHKCTQILGMCFCHQWVILRTTEGKDILQIFWP